MEDMNVISCLEAYCTKISDTMQLMSTCQHAPTKGIPIVCGICTTIQTHLGLISAHLGSLQDEELEVLGPYVERAAHDLLNILWEVCSWSPRRTPLRRQPNAAFHDQDKFTIADQGNNETLTQAIQGYLGQNRLVTSTLASICAKLLKMIQPEDITEKIISSGPEDDLHIYKNLLPVLSKYMRCEYCNTDQHTESSKIWHPARLFLTKTTKAEGLVQVDMIIAARLYTRWQDVSVKIPQVSSRRVAFQERLEGEVPSSDLTDGAGGDKLDSFCHLLEHDYACRQCLRLDKETLFHLPIQPQLHQTCPGEGLSLAQVLENYTLSVKQKIALAYAVSLSFWQFYDSQLAHRAWDSQSIWFMPEVDHQGNKTRIPFKAYISLRPEVTECEEDAEEYVPRLQLLHRCPRILALAILLLEIGLNESFQYRAYGSWAKRLNSRFTIAFEYLRKLQDHKWDHFSNTNKTYFVNVVEQCLESDILTGRQRELRNDCSSGDLREAVFEEVVSSLAWLNGRFSIWKTDDKQSYLSPKLPTQDISMEYRPKDEIFRAEPQSATPTRDDLSASNYLPTVPSRHDFGIVIICALPLEADPVEALFDQEWEEEDLGHLCSDDDPNSYSFGVIGHHNVVVAFMPEMGKESAASVSTNCKRSFPNINLALVIGICGAMPFNPETNAEIILGDVIISNGIVQYDFGRQLPDGFVRKDDVQHALGKPNKTIRALMSKLKGYRHGQKLHQTSAVHLRELQQKPRLNANYPGVESDQLFEASYRHVGGRKSCRDGGCQGPLVPRQRLLQSAVHPAIHFGSIASGDTVMKCGERRDKIAQAENILGFEMEGAGAWDTFPCIVIKGVCDYADSHKMKTWQPYAAASAAACMKAVLSYWKPLNSSSTKAAVRY